MITIQDKWKNMAGDVAPIGYILRDSFHKCWVRIHSLPNSKRYADCDSERTELVERHREVFNFCFDGNTEVPLVVGFYQDSLSEKDSFSWLKEIGLREFDKIDVSDDDDSYYLYLFGGLTCIDEVLFKNITLDVASENIKTLIFFDDVRKIIFAPYDGGIDLFCFDEKKLQLMKAKFINWLSQRSDGL